MVFSIENYEQASTERIRQALFEDNLSEVEDTALVELVRKGLREAFDEIDRRYRAKLCRFLARHASGPDHAEEIAQHALVKAFLSIETLRRGDRLSGWLYQIAFRLAVDEARKERPEQLAASEAAALVDRRPTIELEPEADNLWTIAERILKPDEYSAIWLKYVDGYKIDSIAKIMGRTRISVRVLLFRARKKLLPALTLEGDEQLKEKS